MGSKARFTLGCGEAMRASTVVAPAWSFHAALRALGVAGPNAAVVGDQLFTDVLGGKLAGMRAVLVKPLSGSEFPTTKIVRLLERPMLALLRRRGLLAP